MQARCGYECCALSERQNQRKHYGQALAADTGESHAGVPSAEGPVHHTPNDFYGARGYRLILTAYIPDATSSKRASICMALAPHFPAGRGQQYEGLPKLDSVHFWHSAENGFHQQSMYFIILYHTRFVLKS